MARRSYTKEDVRTHYGQDRPAVNVKVYRDIRDAWAEFERGEEHDPRFTLDWIEENVSDRTLDALFWDACSREFEYLEGWATGKDRGEDPLFPGESVELEQDGRSGGWVVVTGLPAIEDWDAVMLGRWRRFEKIARSIADDVPYQVLSSLYVNEFEAWKDERDDAAAYNAEAPVELALRAAS